MAAGMRRVKIAPKGMGLNDFVAQQEGFFAAEGLDVELDWKTFRGTQSSWKNLDYFQRPQDRPYTEDKQEVIQGACVWGTICNASAGMGKVVPDAYGDSAVGDLRAAGFKNPQTARPKRRAGFSRAARRQSFQRALSPGKVSAAEKYQSRQYRRLRRAPAGLLDGEVEAASLLPPQIAMAEQLGLRKIIEDRFKTLWWAPQSAAPETVRAYLNGLQRAEEAMDANIEKYLPLWEMAVPAEFKDYHKWDFSKFGRGERFVYKRLPQEEFDDTLAQVERWGLDQHLKERSFDKLVVNAS